MFIPSEIDHFILLNVLLLGKSKSLFLISLLFFPLSSFWTFMEDYPIEAQPMLVNHL